MTNSVGHALKRIEDLITVAEGFRTEALRSPNQTAILSNEDLWRFLMSALQTTRAICSESSPHYQELKACKDSYRDGSALNLSQCIGILRAISDDLAAGMLVSIREMVTAEVFDDLIDMANHLLEQGYHLSSIAIAGAVLEDTLRKLCQKHLISWEGDSSINKLNTALYKANIYDKAQFGQLDAWGKLRNKVVHGDFKNANEVDSKDAQRMIDGLRDFITKHLGDNLTP